MIRSRAVVPVPFSLTVRCIPYRYLDDQSDPTSKITYKDLWHGDTNIGKVVAKISPASANLRTALGSKVPRPLRSGYQSRSTYSPRKKGWRPLFGQSGASQGHLRQPEVCKSAICSYFLDSSGGLRKLLAGWCFVKDAPKLHVLWGWLQIGKIRKVDTLTKDELPWTCYHPHRHPSRGTDLTNTLYIAACELNLGDGQIVPGAGSFQQFHEQLLLTNPNGSGVTDWRLPRSFYPDNGKCPLTYHPKLHRWKHDDRYAYLQSASRGQEFVLDLDQYPGVMDWLVQSIFTHDC